jgi:uncharacterized protein YfiM (DUF2279 family)
MIKKFLLLSILPLSFLSAAVLHTDKNIYAVNEKVLVNFSEMTAKNNDWIAIYPKGSSTSWENVIQWSWTNDAAAGDHQFIGLPVGEYQVRAFYNNSYTIEATKDFKVEGNGQATAVSTDKETYSDQDSIVTTFSNMLGDEQDWVAIYPAGSSTSWENMIQWAWTGGTANGTHTFEALPAGDYDARVFFRNSGKLEAHHSFTVANSAFTLSSRKATYEPYELIHADFENMRGSASDWIGIFPVGSDNEKNSAIEWRYAQSIVTGAISFNGLPAGTYEMKAFFATKHKKTLTFTVSNTAPTMIMFEDAEDGIDPRWVHYAGKYPVKLLNEGAQGSAHSIRHRAEWVNGGNASGYYFPFGDPDKKMKFLELDMRIGLSSHIFNFGVIVDTLQGTRRIIFASWMNHPGNDFSGVPFRDPFKVGTYVHMHPGPTDYYLATRHGDFIHYKINIEEKLRILEPDNELLKITGFTTSGGDYDNLTLISN